MYFIGMAGCSYIQHYFYEDYRLQINVRNKPPIFYFWPEPYYTAEDTIVEQVQK